MCIEASVEVVFISRQVGRRERTEFICTPELEPGHGPPGHTVSNYGRVGSRLIIISVQTRCCDPVPGRTIDKFIVQQLALCVRWRSLSKHALIASQLVLPPYKFICQGFLRQATVFKRPPLPQVDKMR